MKVRFIMTFVLASALVLGMAAPAFAGNSYYNRIESYVDARPEQAYMVQVALQEAGWGYSTPAEKALMREAILVAAGESGLNPTNNGNPVCSGLFQIQHGKRMYGRWTAAEVNNPAIMEKYTLTAQPWRWGKVRQYTNGEYLGVDMGWYVKSGKTGGHPSHWAWGPVKKYDTRDYAGDEWGWYRPEPVTYATPRVGEYKIFNPVFNAEIAKRMHDSRGWQPWTVAKKLGIR